MTREEIMEIHMKLCEQARELMAYKNQDYAREDDPFKNFRRHGLMGIAVRLSDKLSRLESYVEKGSFAVTDETLDDTIMDLINYAILFKSMAQDLRNGKAKNERKG